MRDSLGSVVFRCDGTSETGLGHTSRCLALAEVFQELGLTCRFIGQYGAGAARLLGDAQVRFEQRLTATGGQHDLAATIQAAREARPLVLVVDSYLVDSAYISALHQQGIPVLLLDDFGGMARYDCLAVLNYTVGAKAIGYPAGPRHYFLGPEYLLARRRLRSLRKTAQRRSGKARRVLVAIAGVDPFDLSRLVTSALLRATPDLSVHVVVSLDYDYARELSTVLTRFRYSSRAIRQVPDLAEELAWADVAICAGGLTKYESAYVGVPAAVLSQNLDQAEETTRFARHGLCLDLGLWSDGNGDSLPGRLSAFLGDEQLRASISEAGLECFPADSTRIVADEILKSVDERGVMQCR